MRRNLVQSKKTSANNSILKEQPKRPQNYSYSLSIIQFCIAIKLQSSASFRAIEQIIIVMNIYLEISVKSPSHSTVLLWMKKYGYYELVQPKIKGNDWVIKLDESVQFGQNKLLVIYGIRQCEIDFNRPLKYEDLSALVIKSKSTWSGEDIKDQILIIQKQIGKIKYAVAYHGNSIKKALKLMHIPHIYDITHRISLSVEHIYKEDLQFKEYTKQLAYLRGSQALSKMAHVLPSAQRVKARFMNLRPISDWGISVLKLLDTTNDQFKDEKENLAWVNGHRKFIKELAQLNQMINSIQALVKTKGLSKKIIKTCRRILDKCRTKRLVQFKQAMTEYFKQTMNDLVGIEKAICS